MRVERHADVLKPLIMAALLIAGCAAEPGLVGTIDSDGAESHLVHFEFTNTTDASYETRIFFDDVLLIEGTVFEKGSEHCWWSHRLGVDLPAGDHAILVQADPGGVIPALDVTIEAEMWIGLSYTEERPYARVIDASVLGMCR